MMKTLALVCAFLLISAGARAGGGDCPPPPAPSEDQQAAAARAAVDRGFLWRLRRDGRESYLYGTMHVGRLEWSHPGPRLRDALARSDTLALEIHEGDPGAGRPAASAPPRAEPPAPLVLPSALRERLARQVAAACVPPAALEAVHPVMRVFLLQLLAARRDGLEAAYGQEPMLTREAQAAQRRIVGLETASQQVAALVPRGARAQLKVVEEALAQLEAGTTRPVTLRLADAWARGDLDTLASFEQWCACLRTEADRRLYARLNNARNPGLASGIEALHAGGAHVLAAVGALHMVGPRGLPKLLEERGFEVTRIEFDAPLPAQSPSPNPEEARR